MTPKRVIEKRKKLGEYLKYCLEIDSDCCLLDEDKQIIISALEKQIPKKPIFDEDKELYVCPMCKELTAYAPDDFNNYCELCGQAIDNSLQWLESEAEK